MAPFTEYMVGEVYSENECEGRHANKGRHTNRGGIQMATNFDLCI